MHSYSAAHADAIYLHVEAIFGRSACRLLQPHFLRIYSQRQHGLIRRISAFRGLGGLMNTVTAPAALMRGEHFYGICIRRYGHELNFF
jgi:hypothetical protein